MRTYTGKENERGRVHKRKKKEILSSEIEKNEKCSRRERNHVIKVMYLRILRVLKGPSESACERHYTIQLTRPTRSQSTSTNTVSSLSSLLHSTLVLQSTLRYTAQHSRHLSTPLHTTTLHSPPLQSSTPHYTRQHSTPLNYLYVFLLRGRDVAVGGSRGCGQRHELLRSCTPSPYERYSIRLLKYLDIHAGKMGKRRE